MQFGWNLIILGISFLSPLEKDKALHLNKLKFSCSKECFVLSLVDTVSAVLEKK